MHIHGKVALITGAGRGIGRAIALRLATDGADIALVGLSKENLLLVAQEISQLGRRVTTFVADIGQRDQVYAAIDHTHKQLGGFDIMVNNAGIIQPNPILEVTPEEVERVMKVNIEGVLWGIQAAAKKFKALQIKGKIINASSVAGHEGFALQSVYSATKFAVRALTQAAAKELAVDGITVNAYCPGIVETDMWADIDKDVGKLTGVATGETYRKAVANVALQRGQSAEEVAGLVSYLAGPDADYMTGQAPILDGGLIYR